MLASNRPSQSISSPRAQTPLLSLSSPVSSISSPRPTYKTRRPIITNTMSKFKDSLRERIQENVQAVHGHVHRRAASNGSRTVDGLYERPVYISEPQLNGSADSLPSTRLAPLGSGAIVVGTPQEALALSAQRGGYRGPLASASMPSRINQVPKHLPAPVAEEELEYDEPEKSPPLPPIPTSGPNSPSAVQARGMQPQPRRSGESNTSSYSQQNGVSRGFGHVLPDRRSQGSAKGTCADARGSPLVHANSQLHPDVNEAQAHSVLVQHRPKSNPEQSSTSGERDASGTVQPGQSGTEDGDGHSSRPKMHFSSYSDPGACRHDVESDCFASAPQLPIDLASALPQPLFNPVLMSNIRTNMHQYSPSEIIVLLETGESSMKSTFKTLTSRPSFLSTYLNELVASTADLSVQTPLDENGDSRSIYSQHSEFEDSEAEENYAGLNSLFQDHLKSTGVLKPRKPKRRADATTLIHVFLDRPSAPYAHIVAYLRAPILQSHPGGMLPYAARLFPAARHSFATSRLEALLDLRDEAVYLGLNDLMKLCDEELAGRVPLATDAGHSSAHSTHTLCNSSIEGGAALKAKESVENTPPVVSVDIPIVLPTHESRTISPPAKPASMDSSASPKRDNVSQVPPTRKVNKIPNASQLRARGLDRSKPPRAGDYF